MIAFLDRAGKFAVLPLLLLAAVSAGLGAPPASAQPKPPTKAAPKPAEAHPVAAVPQPVSIPAEPQKVNGASPAWTVTCVSHARATPADCAMEQRLFAKETGQLLSIALITVPGATHQPNLVLQLPTGLALQDGVTVTIDEAAARPVPLQSCDARGCFAAMPVSADMLEALRSGKMMTIRATAGNHEKLAFPHMLTDFGTAYDNAK